VLAPPPLQLSDEEAAGLRVALRLAEAQGWPERRALRSAVKKLEAALLPERREGARRLARRVAVAGGEGRETRWLPRVRRAIETRTALDVTYYSDGREELTARRIDPYRRVTLARGRYVIAWCHLRARNLTFRLDRIVRARRVAHRFTPPASQRVADYVGDTPRDATTTVAVTVRFAPEAARLARETYPGAKPAADGGVVLKARVWANRAFCREIARWGGAAEVVAPEAVRTQVREYAKERLRRSGDGA
jgi:proteasome accessory factor C